MPRNVDYVEVVRPGNVPTAPGSEVKKGTHCLSLTHIVVRKTKEYEGGKFDVENVLLGTTVPGVPPDYPLVEVTESTVDLLREAWGADRAGEKAGKARKKSRYREQLEAIYDHPDQFVVSLGATESPTKKSKRTTTKKESVPAKEEKKKVPEKEEKPPTQKELAGEAADSKVVKRLGKQLESGKLESRADVLRACLNIGMTRAQVVDTVVAVCDVPKNRVHTQLSMMLKSMEKKGIKVKTSKDGVIQIVA